MTFFISAQPSDVSFQLRRARPPDLAAAQTLAIEVEDDLLSSGKWSPDLQKGKVQQTHVTTTDLLYKKLANDVLQLKKQLPQSPLPLYQDIPRNYMPYNSRTNNLNGYPHQHKDWPLSILHHPVIKLLCVIST